MTATAPAGALGSLVLNSLALERLDQFFSHPSTSLQAGLSSRFLAKYQKMFTGGPGAFAAKMQYRLLRLAKVVGRTDFSGLRVLDAGAGFGLSSLLLALAGASEVVAVELLPGRVQDLKALAEIAGLANITPVCADYRQAMRARGPLDLVIATFFLSHLREDESFLALCQETIAPGGQLYLVDDNNFLSPRRQLSVRREWWAAEFFGDRQRRKGHFLEQRRSRAEQHLPKEASGWRRCLLRERAAWATRGMTLDEVDNYCHWLLGRAVTPPVHPGFAYCDPKNGVAEERLLHPFGIQRKLEVLGFSVNLFPEPEDTPGRFAGRQMLRKLTRAVSPTFELVATRH